jgi:hypothetical protein
MFYIFQKDIVCFFRRLMYFNYFRKGLVFLKIFLYTILEGVYLTMVKYFGGGHDSYINA